jgi:hypothetical protein
MSHTLRITITDHDTQNTVTRTAYSDRDDWTWMLNEFANAVNGAGFAVDPYALTYHDNDSIELSTSEPCELYFEKAGGSD